MRRFLLMIAAAVVFALPATASADTVTFTAPATGANQGSGGPGQFNLDHHDAYTWRIGGVDLTGKSITSATLTIRNIRNWDSNANRLFIHLLDTARNAGVASFQDAPANQTPVADIDDDFTDAHIRSGDNPLVRAGTGNTFLASQSFTTTARTYVYTFTQDQLAVLSAYFMNGGDVAFGLDPDCHFWNDGIVFSFSTKATPTPEPTTIVLLGTGLAGLYYRRRKKQARNID